MCFFLCEYVTIFVSNTALREFFSSSTSSYVRNAFPCLRVMPPLVATHITAIAHFSSRGMRAAQYRAEKNSRHQDLNSSPT